MILTNALLLIASFAAMEFVAWFTHKYVMHGWLWSLHRDHHQKDHDSFFERNDFFFFFFALPGILLILWGIQSGWADPRVWIGAGISLYGFSYVFVHDIFIHQRIRVQMRPEHPYLRALRRAHRIHHKHLGKEDGECFGMLWVPRKYWPEEKQASASKA